MSSIADSQITPGKAAALIGSCFPAVDASVVRYVGSGMLFDVFSTADDWAFRFPRVDWSGALFETEARTHRLVAEILPSQILIPRVELLAAPTSAFPQPFAGHRFIPGVGADELDEALLPIIQREIATLLSALHSTPAPVAGAAGIRELVVDEGRRARLEHGTDVALTLRGLDATLDRALDWLEATPAGPPSVGAVHLIHGGLESRHLLVDPATGFLNGVIDWTDTHLGDPARDFVFLVTWRGWHFADEVLRLYPHAVDPQFRARLRHMAQLLSLMDLALAHEQGVDLQKHLRAVHNAFATTEQSIDASPS